MSSSLVHRLSDAERGIVTRYTAAIPVKLGAMARELGLEVVLSTLPPGVSGEIRRSDAAGYAFQIRINRHEKKTRQRFTLAHEIAHFLLHRDKIGNGLVDDVLYRSKLSNALEVEANQLGAELIMPYEMINRETKIYDGIDDAVIDALASKFEVSPPAMEIRLGVA